MMTRTERATTTPGLGLAAASDAVVPLAEEGGGVTRRS